MDIDWRSYFTNRDAYVDHVSGMPPKKVLTEVEKLMQRDDVGDTEKDHVLAHIYNKSSPTTRKTIWQRYGDFLVEDYMAPKSGFGFSNVPPTQVQAPQIAPVQIQQPMNAAIQQPMGVRPMQQNVSISPNGISARPPSYNATAGAIKSAASALMASSQPNKNSF